MCWSPVGWSARSACLAILPCSKGLKAERGGLQKGSGFEGASGDPNTTHAAGVLWQPQLAAGGVLALLPLAAF